MTLFLCGMFFFASYDTETFFWKSNVETCERLLDPKSNGIQDSSLNKEMLEKEVTALEEKVKKALDENDPNAKTYIQELDEKQNLLTKIRMEEARKKYDMIVESKFKFMINFGTIITSFDKDLELERRFGLHFKFQGRLGEFMYPGLIYDFLDTDLNTDNAVGEVFYQKFIIEVEINEPEFTKKDLFFSLGVGFGEGIINITDKKGLNAGSFGDEHSKISRLSLTANWRTFERFYLKIGPVIDFERTDFGSAGTKTFKNYAFLFSVNFNW